MSISTSLPRQGDNMHSASAIFRASSPRIMLPTSHMLRASRRNYSNYRHNHRRNPAMPAS